MDAVGMLKRNKGEIISRYGVERIGVFGSQARGEGRSKSDVDVLVKFKVDEETFDHYMDLKFFLEDLLEAIKKIQGYLRGFTRVQFIEDERTIDAIVRNLEIIGEAARSIPAE